VVVLAWTLMALLTARRAAADDATDQARKHYETGLELFYAREHAQALVEFQRAHEIKPRPATLFMMAQCEYLIGSLTVARAHYESYLRESPSGEFVEVAKDRIESINHRPATLVINCVPDNVDVRVTPVSSVTAPGPAPSAREAGSSQTQAAPAPASVPSVAGTAPLASGSAPSPAAAPSVVPPVAETAAPIEGQAPNNFSVSRGRWVVRVSKPNYTPQSITLDLEVAETRPLFFKLDPIPARLEVETIPRGATLYVNGNRARNPYRQDVPPGRYEIFGEATDYESRTDEVLLGPGERRLLTDQRAFQLRYVQRSGRPELVAASALMGAFVGAGAVAASLSKLNIKPVGQDNNVSSVGLTIGGALAGLIAGGLIANDSVPAYIPDNRALFVIGTMWIGGAEGALAGTIVREFQAARGSPTGNDPDLGSYHQAPDLSRAAFVGSIPGLALGITTGAMLSHRAPTYGRVALIQSAAAGGALLGALSAVALQWSPFGFERVVNAVPASPATPTSPGTSGSPAHLDDVMDLSIPSALGLTVGLGAGLLGAYLPDQTRYGPTWQRVGLIDLAAAAGAIAFGIGGCVSEDACVGRLNAESASRARAATWALVGGAAGLGAGVLLTRNVDRSEPTTRGGTSLPMLTFMPMRGPSGQLTNLFGAIGTF
jgi:hypothetical protein